MNPAILVLEDGSIFHGTSLGVAGITCGEVVFNTAMTGYQEILSDPSYTQQIINFTYPHIGNTGINPEDAESNRIWAAGLVVRELSTMVSHWRSEQTLVEYLKSNNVVGITDIDTRHLAQKIRDQGALQGCIMTKDCNIETAFAHLRRSEGLTGKDLTSLVTTPTVYNWPHLNKQTADPYRVVVYDFGVKHSILKYLNHFGCDLTVIPANTTAEETLNLEPDGILFSNGPGDPMACHQIISTIQTLLNTNIPLFGICLGHQLLALALGASTLKMKFGHHGANHPVQDLKTGLVMITSQNHGFTVDENSLPPTLYATHRSLFDGSLQGIRHIHKSVYGFQGHPEASPGPSDAVPLFKFFIDDMKIQRQQHYSKHNTYAKTYEY